MKKLACILVLAGILANNTAYASPSVRRVPPRPHTNYVIVHDHHSHANEVAAGVFIGLGVALVIYAITSERHDPTRLTYRF